MAEVWTFLECYIKRVGSTGTDTAEYSIDAYAEGVTVSLTRDVIPRMDTSGVAQQRIETRRQAEMSINALYSADVSLFDGNNVKLYFMNALGTETWQMTKAYWTNKGWSGGAVGGITYDVTVVGNNFGTV
jgi:hypothetical protein